MHRNGDRPSERAFTAAASSLHLSSPRIRAGLLLSAAGLAGIAIGLAAASGAGPFGPLRSQSTLAKTPVRVAASAIDVFPSPTAQVVHKTVDVYDPPPAPSVGSRSAAPAAPEQSVPATAEPSEHDGGGGDD